MLRATISCRLYRTAINQLNRRHILLMRNRHKTLLRDHSILEVYPKTCQKLYTVSAVPETYTAQGQNRPYINSGESSLRGFCSTDATGISVSI